MVLTYEDSITDLLSLSARKASLETNLDEDKLKQDDQYGDLIRRIRELKQQADATLQGIESGYQIDMLLREQRIGPQPVEQF